MVQSANQRPISQIFDIDTNLKYVIPKFQREYIWKKKDWLNIFNDIFDNDKGYFLGSIICINKAVDVLDIQSLEVIDGQQRLATISLLYAAIYEKLSSEKDRTDEEYITEKNNLKNRLILKRNNKELKLELSLQNNNYNDYMEILDEIGIFKCLNRTPNLGNRRIYKAFRFFKEQISIFTFEQLKQLLENINSAQMVKIEVGNHSDAFMLFESLNNRGEPLSPIDLIKNNILSSFEKHKLKSIMEAFDDWNRLILNLSDKADPEKDYSLQERFLRHYYNAFRFKNEIKIKGITKATRSKLMIIYEALIDKDVQYIFNELIEKSKTYKYFINPEDDDSIKQFKQGWAHSRFVGNSAT